MLYFIFPEWSLFHTSLPISMLSFLSDCLNFHSKHKVTVHMVAYRGILHSDQNLTLFSTFCQIVLFLASSHSTIYLSLRPLISLLFILLTHSCLQESLIIPLFVHCSPRPMLSKPSPFLFSTGTKLPLHPLH